MAALSPGSPWQQMAQVAIHLRLPVQLTLAPLYLWGVFGAGGGWSAAMVGAFVAIHLFLYGGTTVFNSYYDRDTGPVAGLEHPVPLPGWALPFSLLWQALGGLIAWRISPALGLFYLVYAIAGLLYSHPRPRLKARPYTSAVLVLLLQGCGGFLAGWLASRVGETAVPGALTGRFVLMAIVAACTTIGLYPLTQVFQIDEDRARGDRTLAMVLGPRRCFAFAIAAFVIAATAGIAAMAGMGRPVAALLLGLGYLTLGGVTAIISARYDDRTLSANYHRLVALQFAASAAFALFVVVQLVGSL